MRVDSSFDVMYAEATKFAESLDISLTNDSLCNASIQNNRVKSVSNKLKDFFVLFLDQIFIFFDPKSDSFMDVTLLRKFTTHYENILSSNVAETLDIEAKTAKTILIDAKIESLLDLYKVLNIMPASFECIIEMVKIAVTLPVFTASNERFFFHT